MYHFISQLYSSNPWADTFPQCVRNVIHCPKTEDEPHSILSRSVEPGSDLFLVVSRPRFSERTTLFWYKWLYFWRSQSLYIEKAPAGTIVSCISAAQPWRVPFIIIAGKSPFSIICTPSKLVTRMSKLKIQFCFCVTMELVDIQMISFL